MLQAAPLISTKTSPIIVSSASTGQHSARRLLPCCCLCCDIHIHQHHSNSLSLQLHHQLQLAAGAFYLRLVGRPLEVYQYLEPLYNDYRKLRLRDAEGNFVLSHMDELVEQLLKDDYLFDVALPRIPIRCAAAVTFPPFVLCSDAGLRSQVGTPVVCKDCLGNCVYAEQLL